MYVCVCIHALNHVYLLCRCVTSRQVCVFTSQVTTSVVIGMNSVQDSQG